jgi:hypothetical protein
MRWGRVSKGLGCSPGELFDRVGRTGHLAAVVTTGARMDRGVALAQQVPLPVTVDQDATLVKNPIK